MLHAPLSSNIYVAPFDVVYIDLRGSSPNPSSFSFLYYISFVDAHTKYTWIYFLKQKAEELYAFKSFMKFVQN